MRDSIFRCYVEKRPGFDVAAGTVRGELAEVFGLSALKVRLFNRYDIQGLDEGGKQAVVDTVLSEPMCDVCYEEALPPLPAGTRLLNVEALPGQFDIRADSCEQCVQMLLGGDRPIVRSAAVYAIEGAGEADFEKIKDYLINPVECREAAAGKPASLADDGGPPPADIIVLNGFAGMGDEALDEMKGRLGLAMSREDLRVLREYFESENRGPTLAELRVCDTYWSDHCRHTTFGTVIKEADIRDSRVAAAYEMFLSVNGERPVTLMNIATAAMRHFKARGRLPMLDESDEINACTVKVEAVFEDKDKTEDWLLFFKNETHNHPTEIEPFGGAATCIGGAIRDPLSGRAFVYQSMRITGAGDPRKPIAETLPGKLPQRKLTTTAAAGFSSYGNQIGLATGFVRELYHDGYIAKRLEAGAVVGAAPAAWVRRERPAPGDAVVLLGGRTGRDGMGGATGSSKTHSVETVAEGGAEVQKGNAPEERKLQRLFRNPEVTRLVKKCNDFGAGGVSVAIGELADGVEIELDAVPVKYKGLDGTELAISESQERMAVVVAESDLPALKAHAEAENIEATIVARVTERRRLAMSWRGKKIIDIDRALLDTNGAKRYTGVEVPAMNGNWIAASGPVAPPRNDGEDTLDFVKILYELASDLNFCSQKGLVEQFDNSIGAASVFSPYGGKHTLTETQSMAALLPKTGARTASAMAYGFDPFLTEADPFGGSASAVVVSVAKLVAAGVPLDTIHLSLQEYFPSPGGDPARWGQPFAALLGAFSAQMGLGIAAIGGKDSMSGSFGDLDVPPTLISFAVGVSDAAVLLSPEFKAAGHPVYLLETPAGKDGLPDCKGLLALWGKYSKLCREGKVLSAWVCEKGGANGGIMKMALGNMTGFSGEADDRLFGHLWASIVFEASEELEGFRLLGWTTESAELVFGDTSIPLAELREAWEAPLESIFPVKAEQGGSAPLTECARRPAPRTALSIARPKAVIPVFPGTNCEYDTAAAIERAGGIAEEVLIRNLTPAMLEDSVAELARAIASAQMVVFPGGFSGGDEPDGSGKYIVSLFKGERLAEAVHDLLENRDGLVLGICNGFQALIKLGLLPFGRVSPMTADCPTLTFNRIGRHQARYIRTRVSSTMSPWLSKCGIGETIAQPVSHGEGRLTASIATLEELKANGQIAFQYVDREGAPSMDIEFNPNGSAWAIEGLCSPCGRVLGKMGHIERSGPQVAKNVPGRKFLPLFEGGVEYFRQG